MNTTELSSAQKTALALYDAGLLRQSFHKNHPLTCIEVETLLGQVARLIEVCRANEELAAPQGSALGSNLWDIGLSGLPKP